MPLEPGLIGYAAWASLALASKRDLSKAAPRMAPSPRLAMILGYGLLAVSAVAAVQRFGAPIGVVAWLAQLSTAGVLVVLLLSWRPKLALALALPSLAAGAVAFTLAAPG
jgi:hypothetical protein